MNREQALIKLEKCEQKITEYEDKQQRLLPSFLYDYEEVEKVTNTLEIEIMKRDMLIDFIKGGGADGFLEIWS